MTTAAILEKISPEAVQHTLDEARRVATARARDIEDFRDTVTYAVKRSPLPSVAAAFGAGVVFGAAFGWFAHRPARKERC